MLDKLREVAKAARPGPWVARPYTNLDGAYVEDVMDPHMNEYEAANVEYVVTFDPPTVLALLDVAEAAAVVDADGADHFDRLGPALARLREVTS